MIQQLRRIVLACLLPVALLLPCSTTYATSANALLHYPQTPLLNAAQHTRGPYPSIRIARGRNRPGAIHSTG